jgi:putative lipoic acid-binding regulatory protein
VAEPEVSAIEYPVDFPIKVMGRNVPGFAQTVTAIVLRYAPDFDTQTVEMRSSRKNSYLSLTFVIRATSRQQLDALYSELSGHAMVAMVL